MEYINNTTTLIISNNEMEDVNKIVKSLEDSGLLLKGVTETVQNELKGQKGGFLSMLLGTLDTSLLGNLLSGWGVNKKGKGAIAKSISKKTKSKSQGRGIIGAGELIVRFGYGNKKSKKNIKTNF